MAVVFLYLCYESWHSEHCSSIFKHERNVLEQVMKQDIWLNLMRNCFFSWFLNKSKMFSSFKLPNCTSINHLFTAEHYSYYTTDYKLALYLSDHESSILEYFLLNINCVACFQANSQQTSEALWMLIFCQEDILSFKDIIDLIRPYIIFIEKRTFLFCFVNPGLKYIFQCSL